MQLEPRILVEDTARSYRRPSPTSQFDNWLIQGDNLLALRALEDDFGGEIKCIYIDPPFNTGSAFDYYDDAREHSIWLNLMRERFEVLRRLLKPEGVLVVHLDHTEAAYAKVMLDEIFGRSNHLNTITTTTNAPSGFKATAATVFSTANQLLFYARDRRTNPLRKVYVAKEYDAAYSRYILNPDAPPEEWKSRPLIDVLLEEGGYESARAARKALGPDFNLRVADFAKAHAGRVFRTAAVGGGAAAKRRATIERSRGERGRVFRHPDDDVENFFLLNGEQMVFYSDRLLEIDGAKVPAEIITDVWTDIGWTGIAKEGGVEFKNGKKPEALIRRVLEMVTNPGDLVLDSFAGSGTTGAVAHKMGRRWIMVEIGDHTHTHIVPRLRKVIDGADQGGVTEVSNWKGGGGFRYFTLGASLVATDRHGRAVLNRALNDTQIRAAVCKLEGYVLAPSDTIYWQHGRSTETDFIYVVPRTLGSEELTAISEDVGSDRTLKVVCKAWRGRSDAWQNLTLKRIPQQLQAACEWGRDDYKLKIDEIILRKASRTEAGDDEASLAAE